MQLNQQKEFGVDQLTIQGQKQSSNFASKVPRFNANKKNLNPNLGPGRYVPQSEWIKESKRPQKPEFQQIQWQRAPNPPSIPSHDNVFGYEETKAGDLKKQKNPEKIITGVKEDRVGPGQYNIPEAIGKTKKGVVKWKKANKKASKQDNVGPGHYQVEKNMMFPIYKYKQSSVFASNVERATSVQVKKRQKNKLPVGKTRPITAYHNVLREKMGYVDTELSSDSDVEQPGPGYYISNENVTAFNPKRVPQRQQFFGSTVARFEDKIKSKAKVGPGSYNYDNVSASAATRASSHYQNRRPPFSSSGIRFENKVKTIDEPGPGSYAQDGTKQERRLVPVSKNKAFGTTERRFVGKQGIETPGPGQYKPENNIKQLDKKKGGGNMKNSSSMFLSKVDRNPYDELRNKKNNKTPAVGSYNPINYTIEENITKKASTGYENPIMANLKARTKEAIPFSTKTKRFDEKVDETEAWLAPGYYEHQTSFVDGGKQNKNKPKTQNFLRSSERFEKQKVDETPGPGHYSKEDATANWFKRSFNMIFTE